MKRNKTLCLLLITSLSGMDIHCQEISGIQDISTYEEDTVAAASVTGINFFDSEEPLQMTLSFDIREFLKTKSKPEYRDATITVKINQYDSITQAIKIKARGEMRRTVCSFPPIMLKFKDTESIRIQGKGTVKLVTHCSKSALYESYVFKEYLAYRLYNLVTPYSFKTRLVHINYIDINKPDNDFTAYGFLIENEDTMARRNNAVILNQLNITQKHMTPPDMARVAIFNYMIGNTDWSVPLQHNVKIVKTIGVPSDKGIPIAYDFDYSGLVNTVYSTPHEELPIKNVTERYYMGLCLNEEEIKPVIDEFLGMQEQISGTINDFEYLSKGDKKQVEAYVTSFFRTYKSQNILMSDLNRTCKRIY
jgi:hypothetical protein